MSSRFGDSALSQLPRIIGFGDRDPASRTYGCFDRSYWQYRLSDFPSGIFQEAGRLLALVHAGPSEGNPFAGRREIAEWACAAARFWVSKLHQDGSADEVYPFERSFCATAFGLWSMGCTWQLLKEPPLPGADRAARWLSRQAPPPVANQVAASANALLVLSQLAQSADLRKYADRHMTELLTRQTPEGYFQEYGGYDLGYLSLTLSLLAHWHRGTRSAPVLAAAKRAAGFLEKHVRKDGTYDPKGTSRNTQYLYPFGIVYFGSPVRQCIERGLESGRLMHPGWFDDRYVTPMAADYWQTHWLITQDMPTCS